MDATRVGRELADARLRLGLSLEDLAARTKVKVERLRAIEEADRAQLPPYVYLRGFLREYAATVQLDPDLVAERYLADLDDPAGSCDTASAAEEGPAPVVPRAWILDIATQSFHRETGAAVEFPSELAVRPRLIEMRPAEHVPVGADPFDPRRRRLGRPHRRWLLPIVGLIGLAFGYFAVTRPLSELVPAPTSTDPGSTAESTGESDVRGGADKDEIAPASAQPVPLSPESPAPIADGAENARERPNTPTAQVVGPSSAVPVRDAAPVARNLETDTRSGRLRNLTGSWSLTTRVEPTDQGAVAALNRGYRLLLRQEGDRISGIGQKWMENGRTIPPGSRTPIRVDGVLEGNRLDLQFTERDGNGDTFAMTVGPDGTLSGQFESGAANARGRSVARRTGS
jgi:transcriptional regulator with XRE-family HTH domain